MIMKIIPAFLSLLLLVSSFPAHASDEAIESIQEYLDFAPYDAGIILPEQLTEEIFQEFLFIDTRDDEQFEAETIAGAMNIEWREVLSRIDEIPEDQTVILFCNTGTLSSQALLALRVAGRENVLVLQTGFKGWLVDAAFKP